MTTVEICEYRNGKDVVTGRVVWRDDLGLSINGEGDDDEFEQMMMGYVTHSEPTGTYEDGEAWVKSLPEAMTGIYTWARFAEDSEEQMALRLGRWLLGEVQRLRRRERLAFLGRRQPVTAPATGARKGRFIP